MQIGNSRSRSPGITSLASSASRARIQLRLPLTVLISPLWAIIRNGWASSQAGKVLVENRECTTASALAIRSSSSSGKTSVELLGGQHALVDQGAARQRGEVDPDLVLGATAQAVGQPVQRDALQRSRRRRPRTAARSAACWTGSGRSARRRRWAPRASRGRSRCSSAAICSMLALALAASVRRRWAGRRCRPRTRPAAGSSKSTSARRNASGTWIRMPAPSPVFGSAPVAPRWSRLRRASRPLAMMSWLGHAGQRGDEGDAAGVVLERRVVEALGGPERLGAGDRGHRRSPRSHLSGDSAGP